MLQDLITSADNWCSDKLVDDESACSGKDRQGKSKKQKQKKGKKHTKDSSDEEGNEKKCSMKTAEDVISRIVWDEALPSERFRIGYIDRFIGVVEKSFAAFSWEDIASVDYNTLAIPKHRIQYFKYRDTKVWDKNKRLDQMFGSTGDKETIQDIMKSVDERLESCAGAVSDDDSDSDDDVCINVGAHSDINMAGKNKENNAEDEAQTENAENWPREAYYGSRVKPTHFLALTVTDPEIAENMSKVHAAIEEIEPLYHDSIIPTYRMHMTLCCIGLDTDEQIELACQTLRSCKKDLQKLNPKDIKVTFEGVDNFFHKVLYAKVQENDALINFVDKLRSRFREAGIEIRDMFSFVPHMTIVKLTHKQGRQLFNPYLDGRLYIDFKDHNFGSQGVNNVYLCEMSPRRGLEGFYISPASIDFTVDDFDEQEWSATPVTESWEH